MRKNPPIVVIKNELLVKLSHNGGFIYEERVHSKWDCKFRIICAPQYRGKVFFKEKLLEIRKIYESYSNGKGYN